MLAIDVLGQRVMSNPLHASPILAKAHRGVLRMDTSLPDGVRADAAWAPRRRSLDNEQIW